MTDTPPRKLSLRERDALFAEGLAHARRAEEGHQIYHCAAQAAGEVIAKLRAAEVTWREIDKGMNVVPRTARRWMNLTAATGSYVRAGRDAPDDRDAT